MTEVHIQKVKLSDHSSYWRGFCLTCQDDWNAQSLCGPEVHQKAKGHILKEHGEGVIVARNYRMEVKP